MTQKIIKCPVCGTDVSECFAEHGVIVCSFCFEKIPLKTSTSPDAEATQISAKNDSTTEYSVKCKICDTIIKYNEDQAGSTIVCETCREKIVLPSLAALEKYNNESCKTEENSKNQGYIFHVLDVLLQKGHRLLFCFVLVNAAFAVVILQWLFLFFLHNETISLILAITTYLLSVMLMTSPLGEVYLRCSLGCKPIKREEDINFLYPIFSNTLSAARRVDPDIPEDITFFMTEDKDINAFATGRKTVCVTRGLMQCHPKQIEAIIAHEFGHLSHKDTDITLFVLVGNIVINAFFTVMRWIITIIKFILTVIGAIIGGLLGGQGTNGQTDAGGCLGFFFGGFLVVIWNKITSLWWTICVFCQNRAGRQDEFRADEFSFNAGYGYDLCSAFDYMRKIYHADEDPGPQNLMAVLNSSHPPLNERIAHLQELGANYAKERKINKII